MKHLNRRTRVTSGARLRAGLLGLSFALAVIDAGAELPVPCAPCAGGFNFTAPGTSSTYTTSGRNAIVRQALERETFNWASFNIGRGHSVEFRQPGASSIALNRIHDASPSEIFGALEANGQVYLINQNGILFKPGATVDVNTLLASSLDLNATIANLFESVGISNAFNQAGNPAALSANGNPDPGPVVVERGARIRTHANGRAILVGSEVSNAGTIEVSGIGGQAVLIAAKDKVYILLSQDEDVRGFAVEMDGGGTVENLGQILAGSGNITLAGLAVNQRGLLRATTAVAANGSIRLQARDTVSVVGGTTPVAERAGSVEFGVASTTEVIPEPGSTATAADDLLQLHSSIEVSGKDIAVRREAVLHAPGGRLSLRASGRPNPTLQSGEGSIVLERGSRLDVAGSDAGSVPASRNVVSLETRGNELADAPVQRNGPLFGATISFDVRHAPSIANVAGALATVQRGILERTASGGSITLEAGRRVDIERGAVLDVSGGVLRYEAGLLETSKLLKDGVIVDIALADKAIRYDAVLGPVEFRHAKWGPAATEWFNPFGPVVLQHYQQAYVEGKDAGTIVIRSLEVNPTETPLAGDIAGTFRAHTVRGFYQRDPATGPHGTSRAWTEVPRGGALDLLLYSGITTYEAGAGWPFVLDGVSELALGVDGFVLEPAARIELPAGGSLQVAALGHASIDGSIRIPGGAVEIAVNQNFTLPQATLSLGAAARVDVSGVLVNDSILLNPRGNDAPLFIGAGSIKFSSGGRLTTATGSALLANGGLLLDSAGRYRPGDGGSIELSVAQIEGAPLAPVLELGADLSGYVFPALSGIFADDIGARSRLSLGAASIVVGDADAGLPSSTLVLTPDWLTSGGFTDVELHSHGGTLTLEPGVQLRLQPRYFDLAGLAGTAAAAQRARLPGTDDVTQVATPVEVREAWFRSPTSLSLIADPFVDLLRPGGGAERAPVITLGAGSVIETDSGGEVRLRAPGGIDVRGLVRAPAGDIDIAITQYVDATGATDPAVGYDAARAITLYDGAVLDASGIGVRDPFGTSASVFANGGIANLLPRAAGTISLSAAEAYIVAAPGSRIDVSAATGEARAFAMSHFGVPSIATLPLSGQAGRIAFSASNGIQLFADLRGHAAPGGVGGELHLGLDGGMRRANNALGVDATRFPEAVLRVEVGVSEFPLAQPGQALPAGLFGRAGFAVGSFAASGLDFLELAAAPDLFQRGPNTTPGLPLTESRIDFIGDVSLAVAGGLTLNAPLITSDGGRAVLDAGYLRVGFQRSDLVTSDTPLPAASVEPDVKYFSAAGGDGSLRVEAGHIDLVGFSAFRGFGGADALAFVSRGDLRLVGVQSPVQVPSAGIDGALVVAGDVTLRAERIYPTTLTEFEIINQAVDGTVTFASAEGASRVATPLSAAGRLHVRAPRIEQDGRLFAPHGEITLDADSSLVLGPGSLTSVSGGDATILFGRTQVGDWIYPVANGAFVFTVDPDATRNELLPPEKRINLIADGSNGGTPLGVVDIRRGAVIDVLGGGTLLASEFVPGPGGSVDLVDASLAVDLPGLESGLRTFALLPTETGVAPLDPIEARQFEASFGSQVRLHRAIGDLAAGVYAVLPPRYALLPGAYLLTRAQDVSTVPLTADARRALNTAAGLPLVMASFESFDRAAAVEAPLHQYQVETSAQLRTRAEYLESSADRFFVAQAADAGIAAPLLARDAGSLVLRPTADLLLGGRLATAAANGGRGTRVDIAATDIFISTAGSGGTGVNIRATDLVTLNADSLFIGGTRAVTTAATTIEQIYADSVVVDAGVQLTLPELGLTALEQVAIGAGAVLAARGRVPSIPPVVEFAGDGALMMVSTAVLPNVVRSAVPEGSSAVARVAAGASLFGSGSLVIDSAGATILDGTIGAGAGGGIRIGADRIALGMPPLDAVGLRLDAARLQGLDVAALVLASVQPLELYGAFDLQLEHLVIDAPGLRGLSYSDGTANLHADANIGAIDITLLNSAGRSTSGSGSGSGNLSITAGTSVRFGTTAALDPMLPDDGDFDFDGFGAVAIAAPALLGSGVHATAVDGDLTLRTNLIGALGRGSLALSASGDLLAMPGASAAALPGALELLGGKVSLSGATVIQRTRMVTPSGSARLHATSGDLTVDGAIDAGGLSELDFVFVELGTPGGRIDLVADLGDVIIDDDALLSVAGGTGLWNNDAGVLAVELAQGALRIDEQARLRAGAGGGARSGALELDAESFAALDFGALNRALDTGGFFGRRHFRVRGAGDLVVDPTTLVRAHDLKLVADLGAVVIDGTLDASGARGGTIDVAGGSGVRMSDSARLLAGSNAGYASAPAAPAQYSDGFRGGQVELAAPTGTLDLAGGLIDVGGTRVDGSGALVPDASGVIRLTAARSTDNTTLALQPVGTTLTGAHDIQVVGHRAYDATNTGTVLADATTFSAAATTIRGASGLAGVANVRVVPGVELFTLGDLGASVPGTTSPASGLFGNTLAAGVLTWRAGGDLSLAANASIRDGILTQVLNGQSRFIADTAHSWTLQFVAGADLGSADLLATATPGNLVLGNGASIMTGNGDIDLAAGGDIVLGTDAKVLVVGRHFTTAENGGLYDFDGTVNIPSTFLAQFQFLRGVSFPDFGGHVHIAAGGDLSGQGSNQFVSNWHVRMGGRNRAGAGVLPTGTVPQAWGLSIGPAAVAANATTGLFNQGIAAWGGGNIDVEVGGDVSRVQLSIPTVGRQIGSNSWPLFNQSWVTTSNLVDEIGGGVATVRAGGSIGGLDVFVARGEALVTAGGDIGSIGAGTNERHLRFAIGDTVVRVQAAGAVDLGTLINHTGLSLPSTHPVPLGVIPFENAYLTYSPRSSVNVTALGEVRVSNRTGLAAQNAQLQNLYPARLELMSAADDVVFSGDLRLFSNSQAGFLVAAAKDVRSSGTLGSLLQLDLLQSTFPSLANPALQAQLDALFVNLGGHSPQPVHAGNRDPNVMVARDGIITGLSVTTAKRLLAFAGENLFDPAFQVQHVNEGDVSVFRAGNDILMPAGRSPSGLLTTASAFIEIGGPGEAQFIAGGDIDLGTAGGIASVGDTKNPALPDQGADLTLLAGIGDDLAGLLDFAIQNYLVDVLLPFVEVGTLGGEGISGKLLTVLPDSRSGESIGGITAADWDDGLARRAARRENLARYLGSLRAVGLVAPGDGGADDVARLRALDDSLKLGFLLDLLYDELTFAGVEGILGYAAAYGSLAARNATAGRDLLNLGRRVANAASGEDDGRRGYAAVEAFFPTTRYAAAASSGFGDLALRYAGDISSVLSTVQTQDGGSIRSAVPGGLIDAGATQNDAIAKADKDLGFIAFRSGDIKAFVNDNFNVNSTRVFAQNGGDILIWSSFGDIDAGRGAKTAATLPATTATFDEFGNFVDEPPLEVAGSGIRNFAPSGVTPGSLFLFARAGVINAGDAGIGTAGSAFVDANEFQNFTNTDFGGDVAGFSTDVGGISLSLASVGDVAAGATKATDKATADAAERDAAAQAAGAFEQPQLSIISVEVLGFGG